MRYRFTHLSADECKFPYRRRAIGSILILLNLAINDSISSHYIVAGNCQSDIQRYHIRMMRCKEIVRKPHTNKMPHRKLTCTCAEIYGLWNYNVEFLKHSTKIMTLLTVTFVNLHMKEDPLAFSVTECDLQNGYSINKLLVTGPTPSQAQIDRTSGAQKTYHHALDILDTVISEMPSARISKVKDSLNPENRFLTLVPQVLGISSICFWLYPTSRNQHYSPKRQH